MESPSGFADWHHLREHLFHSFLSVLGVYCDYREQMR
jgi:hypothetical protein